MILSDIEVYQELYSKWARFFPVGDHEALASEIALIIASPPSLPARSELEARFSWDETARLTAQAYENALS